MSGKESEHLAWLYDRQLALNNRHGFQVADPITLR